MNEKKKSFSSMNKFFVRIKTLRSATVRYHYFLSFLFILILPIAIFLIATNLINAQLHKEIENSGKLILENTCQKIEENTSKLNDAFRFILTNKDFSDVAKSSIKNKETGSFYYDTFQLQRQLSAYRDSTSVNLVLYFHQKDFIVADNTANESKILHMVMRSNGLQLPYEDWKTYITRDFSEYLMSDNICISSRENQFVYAKTIFVAKAKVTVFAMLPHKNVIGSISADKNKVLLIADNEGQVFSSSDENLFPPCLNSTDLSDKSGKKYYIQTYFSKPSNLLFGLAVPTSYFWKTYISINIILGLSLAIALLLGVLAVNYATNKNSVCRKSPAKLGFFCFQRYNRNGDEGC